MCGFKIEVETIKQFLLRCQIYSTQRSELFESLEKVEQNFLSLSANNQVFILLYDSETNNSKSLNKKILGNVISYLKPTTRFNKPLIDF